MAEEEAFMVRSLSSSEVVTYGPCDQPKCPAVQKPTGPPPPGYECNCADPSEHPDCKCNVKTGCCAEIEKEEKKKKHCACKGSRIRTRARTIVVSPHAQKPRPARNEQRKFAPQLSEPNPLPPVADEECRPNVAKIGPGSCRRGGTSRTCEDKNSGCKNKDNASMGFVAATLTDEVDPSDKPESCEGDVESTDAVSSTTGPQGTSHATVQLKNKCTGKKRWLHKANVYVEAPNVVSQNGQTVSTGSGSGSFNPSIGGSSSLSSFSGSVNPAAGSVSATVTPSQLQDMIQSAVRGALASQSGSGSGSSRRKSSSANSLSSAIASLSQSSLARSLLSGSSSGSLSAPPGSSSAAVPLSGSSQSK